MQKLVALLLLAASCSAQTAHVTCKTCNLVLAPKTKKHTAIHVLEFVAPATAAFFVGRALSPVGHAPTTSIGTRINSFCIIGKTC